MRKMMFLPLLEFMTGMQLDNTTFTYTETTFREKIWFFKDVRELIVKTKNLLLIMCVR